MPGISSPGYYIVEMSTEDVGDTAFHPEDYPVTYRIVFSDETGVRSQWSEIVVTDDIVHVPGTYDSSYRIVLIGLPAPYSGVAHKLLVYRKKAGQSTFYHVGESKAEDEGIFVDYNRPATTVMPCVDPVVERYESSFRWSEVNAPSHLRLENLEHVADGDGDQITGAALLYSNLIVFKETSIHRYALQGGADNPISRYDIVSPDIGCIAPQTIIVVHNRVYFLSWEGWYSYDNNVLRPIDAPCREEIMDVLHDVARNGGPRTHPVSMASSAYNPTSGELYLNIPRSQTDTARACVFVLALEKGYATKFRYMRHPDFANNLQEGATARRYYTNSLGELRSADRYAVYGLNAGAYPSPRLLAPAGVYIEAPTETWRDEVLNAEGSVRMETGERGILIHATARSKYFIGAGTHFISRIRRLNLLLHRIADAVVTTRTATRDFAGDLALEDSWLLEQFEFVPAAGNLISLVPRTPYEPIPASPWINSQQWSDLSGKPVRFAFDIDTDGYAELLAYALHWRPIHTYLL